MKFNIALMSSSYSTIFWLSLYVNYIYYQISAKITSFETKLGKVFSLGD